MSIAGSHGGFVDIDRHVLRGDAQRRLGDKAALDLHTASQRSYSYAQRQHCETLFHDRHPVLPCDDADIGGEHDRAVKELIAAAKQADPHRRGQQAEAGLLLAALAQKAETEGGEA